MQKSFAIRIKWINKMLLYFCGREGGRGYQCYRCPKSKSCSLILLNSVKKRTADHGKMVT